ncbi:hypothetical protein THALO_190004 [Tenacibaculum halocynthiae]
MKLVIILFRPIFISGMEKSLKKYNITVANNGYNSLWFCATPK